MSLKAGTGENQGAVNYVSIVARDNGGFRDMPYPADFVLEVGEGNVEGHSVLEKFGRNPDIDTATGPEDVWHGGGLYTGFPTGSAETIECSTLNAADTAAGTGLRTIRLYGQLNGIEQTEDVTLAGASWSTPTTKLWDRMHRVRGLTAGSGGSNVADLICRHTTTTSNIFAVVPAGSNRSQIAAFTVPANTTLYLKSFDPRIVRASGAAGSSTFAIMFREYGGIWEQTFTTDIATGASGPVDIGYALELPARTDIVARVLDVSDNNTSATVSLFGMYSSEGHSH
jgi:hypothetical protein